MNDAAYDARDFDFKTKAHDCIDETACRDVSNFIKQTYKSHTTALPPFQYDFATESHDLNDKAACRDVNNFIKQTYNSYTTVLPAFQKHSPTIQMMWLSETDAPT